MACPEVTFAHMPKELTNSVMSTYCKSEKCNKLKKDIEILSEKEKEAIKLLNDMISGYKDPFVYEIAKKMNEKKVLISSSKELSKRFELQKEVNDLEQEMLTRLRTKYKDFNIVLENIEEYQYSLKKLNIELEQAVLKEETKDFLSPDNLELLKAIQSQNITEKKESE